ncbi:hypothetical protein RSOLAG1IB_06365 [Rhizoctonia solani AG-1 IB]|uniref:FAD-binding domain-containing protein n=1 Tax=Thanatephorus cucumeris (strain AG1-IB / isolate 7/3/14) TaxID=1108050 RepID=A0A0B7F613_THACB|nr:hypothetical protein RSOLAG1IB_06365 [Rhizoctonia solani AG-1 IB]
MGHQHTRVNLLNTTIRQIQLPWSHWANRRSQRYGSRSRCGDGAPLGSPEFWIPTTDKLLYNLQLQQSFSTSNHIPFTSYSQVHQSNFTMSSTKVDALIIGAGPAGLMCAYNLSQAGLHVRIVDKKAERLQKGQGDVLQTRGLEIIDSLGLSSQILKDAQRCVHTTTYALGHPPASSARVSVPQAPILRSAPDFPSPLVLMTLMYISLICYLSAFFLHSGVSNATGA